MKLQEGQIIRDTYEVERFLGEGAFAEVYRVKHRFLGRQAMKVFKRTGITLEEIESMLNEAIILSRIAHPNIVQVFDANVIETPDGPCGYFTMENVPGGSLYKFWNSHGNLFVPIETTVDIVTQICRGLQRAHSEKPPIVHRDIKPENILVAYEASGLRARISDFGLAKKVNPLNLMATSAGTVAFKPPEAFNMEKGDSCASDVWAIGMTLYLLLTDKLPFDVSNLGWGNKVEKHLTFELPSRFNPACNDQLDQIVSRSLAFNPADRYPSAKEFLVDLEAWKPSKTPAKPKAVTSDNMVSKAVIGQHMSSPDETAANKMVAEALELKKKGKLSEAADTMEEAFNKSPKAREKYENQVKRWRCGIAM
jgi:serine/threonine-protein kinase